MIRGNRETNNILGYGAFLGKKRKLFKHGGRESLRFIIKISIPTRFLAF